MENDKIKKKGLTKAVIILAVLVVIALGAGYAYAKYVTSKNGEAQAEIAEWNVAISINDNTNEDVNVDLAKTRIKESEEADVQDGYVAPGTAGKFNIEVNAENSDVSLEYEITMNTDYQNNQKFPKNLIFYSDESMQNALYHTENAIKLNGFISYNDSEKKDTIPIYWKWAYQTGATDMEMEENDVLDSAWMGRTVDPLVLKIVARQVNTNQNENQMTNQYAVTLDANGGTIQGYGNAKQVTKNVINGQQYGDLPTPVREGYKFVGWTEDLFDEKDIFEKINGVKYENGYWTFKDVDAHEKYGNGIPQISGFKDNTQYTLFVKGYTTQLSNLSVNFRIFFHYTDNTDSFQYVSSTSEQEKVYESTANKTVDYIGISYGDSGMVYLSQVKLIEGTSQNPKVTESNTIVTSKNNHTLTAIWEPASTSNP